MSDSQPVLGLVVIGRNEGERLKRCLRSVPKDAPIFYVDSASTDDSVEFAKSVQAVVVELDMAKPFTAARARNEGFAALLNQYPQITFVQFVDGDCELERDWLGEASAFLKAQKSVAAVCGRRRERNPGASLYNRMCDEEWDTEIGQADSCGGDVMIRVQAFKDAEGYDATMIAGEEPELCSRLRAAGWKIWRLDLPMTIHDADMHSFDQYWKRAIRSGFGYAQVLRKTSIEGKGSLYRREVARALLWTIGVVGIAVLCGMLFGIVGLAIAPTIWLMQWMRLGIRHGFNKGGHILVSKVAESIGIMRFLITQLRGRTHGAIFYK